MKWCEKKKVTCNMDWCNGSTCLLNLPDNHGEGSIVGVEVNEDYLPVGERQVQEFKQMLNEVAEKGDAVIREHYTLTKLHDDHIKQIKTLKNELKATEDLLDSFSSGSALAPNVEDELKALRAKVESYESGPDSTYEKGSEETAEKIIEYLSEAVKKSGSKKVVINKAITWIKENFYK